MERIRAVDVRVSGWSSVSREATRAPLGPAAPPIDPTAALEKERAHVLEAARAEGFAQGMLRAEAEIRARTQAAEKDVEQRNASQSERLARSAEQVKSLLQSLSHAVSALDVHVEGVVMETAFVALVRLLGTLAADGKLMNSLCGQALSEFRQRPVIVRLHPDDANAMVECPLDEDVRIVSDGRMHPGQCRLETHKGQFDTGLDVRLDALKHAFLATLAAGN